MLGSRHRSIAKRSNRWGGMTYRVIYGDPLAMLGCDNDRAGAELFGTEHEALNRARQILDQDFSRVVVIRDDAGNELSGVRLQLRLGYCFVE
jgi:hypothetical protein